MKSQAKGLPPMRSIVAVGDAIGIPGYRIEEVLGSGATSDVYRASRGGEEYAIKVMKLAAGESAGAELRFRREGAALARLNDPALVKVFEVGDAGSRPYLVMECLTGQSLAALLKDGPLTEQVVLGIASSIGGALREVHRHQLVHRDVKPENVIVDPSGKAKLIDFGFALDAVETDQDSKAMVGTLLYCAPEQSGMLKRPVDCRADLYSLGAVLFECLCGIPPFRAASVADLMYQHAAVQAPDIRQFAPSISPVVAEIVKKLLAKDPDDRYQSARALLSDLEHLGELQRDIEKGEQITLGRDDHRVRGLQQSVPLVGRQRERDILEQQWGAVLEGRGSAIQVEGEGGSGKSRLVRELLQGAFERKMLVLSGKCQQLETVPFGPLREAIDEYISGASRLPRLEKERALAVLGGAAGEFASIVRRLSRSLERLFSDAPEIGQLDPGSEEERFFDKVAELFLNMAKIVGGGIFVVDDIQWLDPGSLKVLTRVADRISDVPLLLITTARNDPKNEVAAEAFVAALDQNLSARIKLAPLSLRNMDELVAAHLGGRHLEEGALSRVAAVANGNPFAVGEYVRALLESGGLGLVDNKWVMDKEKFQQLAVSKDVRDLVTTRVSRLDRVTSDVLVAAAVAGTRFRLALLKEIVGVPLEVLSRALGDALEGNLIEQIDGDAYTFVHDRVLEACVSHASVGERQRLHQAAARSLEANGDRSVDAVFALARHYSEGIPLEEPGRAVTALHDAGKLSLGSYANENAYEFLKGALRIASEARLGEEDVLGVLEDLAIACTRTARMREGREYLARVLRGANTAEKRGRVRFLNMSSFFNEGKVVPAWVEFEKGLKVLGSPYPRSKVLRALSMAWYWLLVQFLTHTGIGFGRARGGRRSRHLLLFSLYETATIIAYFLGDLDLWLQLTIRQLYNVHFLGTCPEYARAHAFYAFMMSDRGAVRAADHHGTIALNMARQLGDKYSEWFCHLYFAQLGKELQGKILEGERAGRDNSELVKKWCGPYEVSCQIAALCYNYAQRGYAAETVSVATGRFREMEKSENLVFRANVRGLLYSQNALLGNQAEALRWRRDQREMAAGLAGVPFAESYVHTNEIQALLDQGELGTQMEEAIDSFLRVDNNEYWNRYGFGLVAEARLAQLAKSKGRARRRARRDVARAMWRFGRRVRVPSHQGYLFALRGWAAREDGQLERASRLLCLAEYFGRRADNQAVHFLVARERARIAHARSEENVVRAEAEIALNIARARGWVNRADSIKKEFAVLETSKPGRVGEESRRSISESTAGAQHVSERFVDALLEVAVACTSSLDSRKQAQAALDETIRLLGAERAFLFLVDSGSRTLQLESGRDSSGNDIQELTGYSSTVVRRVYETRDAVVVAGTEEGEALGSESAVAFDLRSIMAAPLIVRGVLIGVVYIDSRLAKGLFTQREVVVLQALANHIAIAVQTARDARLAAEAQVLEKDIALTGAVQSLFLPRKSTYRDSEFDVYGLYRPAAQCGGDWWWYGRGTSGALQVLVGDVTGHGVASAMVTASVATSFRVLSEQGGGASLLVTLKELGAGLRKTTDGAYRMTMSAVDVDVAASRLRWITAGAPPIIVLHADGGVEVVAGQGTPLGSDTLVLGEVEHPVRRGDRIVVFTDGVSELRLPRGRELGMRSLVKLVRETKGSSASEAGAMLMTRFDALRESVPQADDVTFAIVDVLPA